MKRPLVNCTIAFLTGIIFAYIFPSFGLIALLGVFLLFAIFAIKKHIPDKLTLFIIMIAVFTAGGCEYLVMRNVNIQKFENYYGKDVVLHGSIDSEPDIRSIKINYVFKTEEIVFEGINKKVNGKILLSTLNNKEASIYGYGTSLTVQGQLKEPKGQRNPGGFDYRKYLSRSGISATMFAMGDQVQVQESKKSNIIVEVGIQIRNRIVSVISKSLPAEQAGLLNGMLIGYREGLTEETKESFSDAGLTHIMAASGMNVAFIVFPLFFILKKLRMRESIANPMIILILIMFVFVTGFSPSILRAVIMAIVLLAAKMIRREADVMTSIAFAALILLIFNPQSLFDVGFQLSFAATLSIILFYKPLKSMMNLRWIPGLLADVIAVTMASQIGTIPITAFYFNKISLISLLSNLVVVPIVEVVSILGFAMAILGQFSLILSQWIGYVNCAFLTFILFVTKMSASIPYAVLLVITPSLAVIIVYYAAFLGWLKKDKLKQMKVNPGIYITAATLVVVLLILNFIVPKDLQVVFLDVGQGDASLIRTPSGKNILIDGGGSSSKDKAAPNVGEMVVIPFLLDYGISKLDMVVATHAHDDHIQGLKPVLKELGAQALVTSEDPENSFKELKLIAREHGIDTLSCTKGDVIKVDDQIFFKVLYPEKEKVVSNSTLNNNSLVLKLKYQNISVLFTGDMEQDVENQLLSENAEVKSDVLKVAHHGSITSSGEDFLKAVEPQAAVISVGKNNFGHPSEKVIDRIHKLGAHLLRTDQNGAILMRTNGKQIKFSTTVNE
ncbi:MAG: DNA internalization-related competence protein ComEC/Rec2 [Clostridia bacterium]|nr:DNA internalization-related competence protein ComEC/Rec2 [Clostridia bacterium]